MSWNAKSIFPPFHRWRLSFIDPSLFHSFKRAQSPPIIQVDAGDVFKYPNFFGKNHRGSVTSPWFVVIATFSRDFLHPSTYKVRKKMGKQKISDDFLLPKKKIRVSVVTPFAMVFP